MSSTHNAEKSGGQGRKRLSRQDRHRQLLDTAWLLVREEGTDALTLGRLSERAGVTKPVVYDHFGTRPGLLAALYHEFDTHQIALMEEALDTSEASLESKADVIASSYVDCVLAQGREIPEVIAALAGAHELETLKRECEIAFMDRCRQALRPFTNQAITTASLRAMLGAAEGLSYAAATGEINAQQAKHELFHIVMAISQRGSDGATSSFTDDTD